MRLLSRRLKLMGFILVIVLPLLGVITATAVARSQPTLYEGRVDLVLPPLEGAWDSGSTGEAFAALIEDPTYRRAVAEASGIEEEALQGLGGSARGFGEAVVLTFQHRDRAAIRPTLEAAANLAVQRLYGPETEGTRAQLVALRKQRAEATEREAELEEQAGGMEPDDRYWNLIDIVKRLRFDLSVKAAQGDQEERTGYERELAKQETAMLAMKPLADEYQQLKDRRDELDSTLSELQVELQQTEAGYAAVDVEQALDSMTINRSESRDARLRAAVLGGGAGLFVALAALATLALMRVRQADRLSEPTSQMPKSRKEISVG